MTKPKKPRNPLCVGCEDPGWGTCSMHVLDHQNCVKHYILTAIKRGCISCNEVISWFKKEHINAYPGVIRSAVWNLIDRGTIELTLNRRLTIPKLTQEKKTQPWK